MEIQWLAAAINDLNKLDLFTKKTLVAKIEDIFRRGPEQGEIFSSESKKVIVRRLKIIPGYWITFTYNHKNLFIIGILECKRECMRGGSKHATVRITQIREETKEEFNRLELLLSK